MDGRRVVNVPVHVGNNPVKVVQIVADVWRLAHLHLFCCRKRQGGVVARNPVDVPLEPGLIDHVAVVIVRDVLFVCVDEGVQLVLRAADPAAVAVASR